ncbi:hypothetical protein [Actinokineospora enzanensis]|uniref:hypothetical protein n=1 Tax=Actinokineospora enzanensis TaxID=155975 RepID=UPI000374650C|nr:hypothetical protein [Actinokineospora enzanensis]
MNKNRTMIVAAGLLALAAVAGAAGNASAATHDTNIPGGDYLEARLQTQGGWSGVGTSCITVQSDVILYGNNPFYAQSIKNETTLDAYGFQPTLSWRGITRRGGNVSVSLTDSYTNGYDWRSTMGGAACINVTTPYITGVTKGSAYVPSQGGWYYSNAGMN